MRENNVRRRYNRAVGIAEFIVEGHTIEEIKEEFEVSKETIRRDLEFLFRYGYDDEEKRNKELYYQAKAQLLCNMQTKARKV